MPRDLAVRFIDAVNLRLVRTRIGLVPFDGPVPPPPRAWSDGSIYRIEGRLGGEAIAARTTNGGHGPDIILLRAALGAMMAHCVDPTPEAEPLRAAVRALEDSEPG